MSNDIIDILIWFFVGAGAMLGAILFWTERRLNSINKIDEEREKRRNNLMTFLNHKLINTPHGFEWIPVEDTEDDNFLDIVVEETAFGEYTYGGES